MMETDNKYDHQTDIESVAGESVVSVSNVPLTQEIINTEDTLQRSASQVLEQKQSQLPSQQSGTEVQQTGRFQIIPVTNTSDLEQKNFSETEKTAVKPVKQIGRFEISVASQSFDNTTTSLNQTLVTEQASENKQQAPPKPEHHSTPTKSRKDFVLTRDGSAESVSSPLMLDHTVQDERQFLNATLNSVALSSTQVSMQPQFVPAEQVTNRPYVPLDVNNQSWSTSIVNQHQLAEPKNPHPLNSPTQSQYGDDDSDDPNEDDREYKELIKRQQAEMETLFRKHQREFQRLIMLKKKKRMKSKKELQNLIQMEGAGKVVVAASGEIVNNPSQTSSNDSIERRAPQPSGDPLRSYSDAPLGTQNLSTEVADGSLYKAGYNQDAYAAQVNTSKFSADKTLQNVSKQQNLGTKEVTNPPHNQLHHSASALDMRQFNNPISPPSNATDAGQMRYNFQYMPPMPEWYYYGGIPYQPRSVTTPGGNPFYHTFRQPSEDELRHAANIYFMQQQQMGQKKPNIRGGSSTSQQESSISSSQHEKSSKSDKRDSGEQAVSSRRQEPAEEGSQRRQRNLPQQQASTTKHSEAASNRNRDRKREGEAKREKREGDDQHKRKNNRNAKVQESDHENSGGKSKNRQSGRHKHLKEESRKNSRYYEDEGRPSRSTRHEEEIRRRLSPEEGLRMMEPSRGARKEEDVRNQRAMEEDSAFANRNVAPKTSSSSMNSLPSIGSYVPTYPMPYSRTPQYQSNYPPFYPFFTVPPHGFTHYQDDQNMGGRENPRLSGRAPPGFLPQHQQTQSSISAGYDGKSHHRGKQQAQVTGNDEPMQDEDWGSSSEGQSDFTKQQHRIT